MMNAQSLRMFQSHAEYRRVRKKYPSVGGAKQVHASHLSRPWKRCTGKWAEAFCFSRVLHLQLKLWRTLNTSAGWQVCLVWGSIRLFLQLHWRLTLMFKTYPHLLPESCQICWHPPARGDVPRRARRAAQTCRVWTQRRAAMSGFCLFTALASAGPSDGRSGWQRRDASSLKSPLTTPQKNCQPVGRARCLVEALFVERGGIYGAGGGLHEWRSAVTSEGIQGFMKCDEEEKMELYCYYCRAEECPQWLRW